MWAKLSSALRSTTSRNGQDDQAQEQSHSRSTIAPNQILRRSQSLGQSFRHSLSRSHSRSQAEVLTLLLEDEDEDSNKSILPKPPIAGPSSLQTPSTAPDQTPSQDTPPSPSRRSLFKRTAKESDSVRASSPSLSFLPKKIRGNLPFGHSSQTSLASPIVETQSAGSQHKSQPSQDTIRSLASVIRRPSLDVLRSAIPESAHPSIDSPVVDSNLHKHSSVRSILRDPKTPGSGQNVRFFARDAYKFISPEESVEENFLSPLSQIHGADPTSFVDRLNKVESNYTSPPVTRHSPPGHKIRPSLTGVFGPLESSPKDQNERDSAPDRSVTPGDSSVSSMEFASAPMIPPDFNANGSWDLVHPVDLPQVPLGIGLDVGSPLLDSAIDLELSISGENPGEGQLTSTPFRPASAKAKGLRKEETRSIREVEERVDENDFGVNAPRVVEESIFHAQKRQPIFSPPLHERSQSFSFGQTVYYSTGKASPGTALSPAYPSSDNTRPQGNGSAGPSAIASPPAKRHRSRALSDTAFQDMLRAASPVFKKMPEAAPEADINDASSQDLILYANQAVPDPFNVKANTYYTPQTMIPTTPPAGVPRHTRKPSKEESLIYSLQTELALQQELCSQYEADLRTKDEMVALLGSKVADLEKQENQRKGALRQWKKKVQELEKAVRFLEEEVDISRQESMERSVMDEASGEALRMLHRQIASLERERQEWLAREQAMKDEAQALEALVKDRSKDAANLQKSRWTGDDGDRELDNGSTEAKEQIDESENTGLVKIKEEELRRLVEREQRVEEQQNAYRVAEMNWEQEREDLTMKLDSVQVEKTKAEEQLGSLKQQLKAKEEEFDVLKNELEAQWGHTETASERIDALQRAKQAAEEDAIKSKGETEDVMRERDILAQKCDEVEDRVNSIERDWNESENKRFELESEVHELWDTKETMEKEREELEVQLAQERGRSEELDRALHECENRISQLEEKCQANSDNVFQLEEVVHQRDEEIARYSRQVREQESEAEALRKEIGKLDHERSDLIDEHRETLKEVNRSEGEAKRQVQDLLRQQTEADTEIKSFKERIESLKNEMDRLRKHIHDLQQESADKEVKVLQLMKQHSQDKEDMQGLNIALDAKQQELELYKRKAAMKSGSTSVPTSASAAKVVQRRESSSLFNGTPASTRPPSRATSIISDSGSAKGDKVSALGKSSRINVLNGTSSTTGPIVRKRVEGSMGPPLVKRSSVTTISPAARPQAPVLSRVKSPTGANAITATRRRVVSSVVEKPKTKTIVMSPTSSESSEKENMSGELGRARRRSMVPAPM